MKYFTAEMYVRFNEVPDDESDAAHEEWELAGRRYERRYKKIAPQLPEELRRFHDEQCLHDADVVGPALLSTHLYPWNSRDVTIVAQQINTLIPQFKNTLAILQYAVTEPPVVEQPLRSAVFSDVQPIWLYDEIDLVEPGVFSHEILISNGFVVKLRFREFHYHIARLLIPSANGDAVQPAPQKSAST
jgi:hypothetical protein